MHPIRKLNRLQGYDYSRNALYFVTSCVQDKICCFGEIKDNHMFLNEYGEIAEKQWGWLEQQYRYIMLHSFVVMPNHIHVIIEINDTRVVGTRRNLSLQNETKIKSLSELMGAYKTTTSKQIHLAGFQILNGKDRFMIILLEMKNHFGEFQITFQTIL